MGEFYSGEPIHMEAMISAGTSAVATLFNMGSSTARTLLATEYVTITDVILSPGAAGTYTLCADSDAAGKRVLKLLVADETLNPLLTHHFQTPFTCPIGVVPKLIAPNGTHFCTMTGTITGA
jgi:hypothetical protein